MQGNVPAMIFWLECRAGWNQNATVRVPDAHKEKTALPLWLLKAFKGDEKAKTSDGSDQKSKAPRVPETRPDSEDFRLSEAGREGSERAAPHH